MILDIHIPAGWHERLGAVEGDRILVDETSDRWALYCEGRDGRLKIKRSLVDEEILSLRITTDDCRPYTLAPDWKYGEWLRYGFTRPDFLRWVARGVFEPDIAAELRGAGVDPDRDSTRLTMFAAALCDGDLSVAAFLEAR